MNSSSDVPQNRNNYNRASDLYGGHTSFNVGHEPTILDSPAAAAATSTMLSRAERSSVGYCCVQ